MNNETEILEDLPVTNIEKKESIYSIFDENGRKIEIEETYKKVKKPIIVKIQKLLLLIFFVLLIMITFYLIINEPDLIAEIINKILR